MKPSSCKAKGRKFQQYIRDLIRTTFKLEDDDVESRSMGCGGEDIMLSPLARSRFPFSVECKHVERLNVYEAYNQASTNSKKYEPVLFMKKNRKKALAVVDAEYFFKLVGGLYESKQQALEELVEEKINGCSRIPDDRSLSGDESNN